MLAQIVRIKTAFHHRHEMRPLAHKLPPIFLRTLETHRIIVRVLRDHILQLLSHRPVREDPIDRQRRDPIVLLRRHVRRRENAVVRVDEPQDQEAAVAWPRRVGEFKGVHAVLEGVWEGEQAVLLCV